MGPAAAGAVNRAEELAAAATYAVISCKLARHAMSRLCTAAQSHTAVPCSCMQFGALFQGESLRASSAGHGRLQGQQAKRRSATVASAMDGAGYNSDEEVYAVARAIDAEDEVHLLRPLATDFVYPYKDANMGLPSAQVQQE